MNKCIHCGKPLTHDEIALHRKLFGKTADSFMCINCCSDYLNVPERLLEKKIVQFKEMGCTLFACS